MRKILLAALLLVFTSAVGQPRRVTNMDAGWRFYQGDVMGAEAATYDDMDWRKLDVPHDCSGCWHARKHCHVHGYQMIEE